MNMALAVADIFQPERRDEKVAGASQPPSSYEALTSSSQP
jgi:hypothetical protein